MPPGKRKEKINHEKIQKNQKYDTQLIGKIVDTYKFAKKQGDHILMQRQANLIYEFTKKYVLNVLWENYNNIFKKSTAS